MRPQDAYEYIAIRDIAVGMTYAFRTGDPVPASTVKEQGYGKDDVVLAADYRPVVEGERAPAPRRGEMPPHLAAKAVPDPKPAKATAGKE